MLLAEYVTTAAKRPPDSDVVIVTVAARGCTAPEARTLGHTPTASAPTVLAPYTRCRSYLTAQLP